jgi:hypothetical protein
MTGLTPKRRPDLFYPIVCGVFGLFLIASAGEPSSNTDELSAGRILGIHDDGFRRFERRLDAERQTGGSEANLVAV